MRSRTANWFICKIRYEKVMEDGLQKKVTEQYVVDALSFTEAETRITATMSTCISGEFEVVEIDRCVFKEVFFMGLSEKMTEGDVEDLLKAAKKGDKEAGKEIMNRDFDASVAHAASRDTSWYKSKVAFITIDEKTDKEKRTNVYYLVEGISLESARKNIDEVMGSTMIDYVICSVSETKIEDVFEYVYVKKGEKKDAEA